jgi:hypothetical protein
MTRQEHIALLQAELAKKRNELALLREQARRVRKALHEAERVEFALEAAIHELGLEETPQV